MTEPQEWLSFPDAPRIVKLPPGPRSREMLAAQGAMETPAIAYPSYFPIGIAAARGATIEDVDGNRFIDWVSGVSVLNLGHNHPRLRAALEEQAGKIWHALEVPTSARVRFLELLRDSLPGTLRNRARIFFSVTGGDAVETAVSLAERATGRHGVMAFSGAYHGVHGGAVGLTSGRRYRQTSAFPGGRVVRVPFPDPYRPVLGADHGSADTLRYMEHLVTDPHSGADPVAAVLVEPVLGEGGYIVPPDDFLPALREFCDEHGILLILDEIQTGLGRTGRMWACEHAGVTPDIMCIAKTIGGGIPLALVAYREDLLPELPKGFHLGTYRGNTLALAVGAEVLRILREEPWIGRASERGRRLLNQFRELAGSHPWVGDVRGKGFMIGIELVQDSRRQTPWTERANALRQELFQRGLLMHTCGSHDHVMRFMSPLIIEDELLDRGLETFQDALGALDATLAAGRRDRKGPARVPVPLPTPSPGPLIPPPVHPLPAPPPPGRSISND